MLNEWAAIYDQVIITDLTVIMSVGIHPKEKEAPQRVIFNVIIDVDSNEDKKEINIRDIVSYEDVCNDIKRICAQKHYDLLEELLESIAQFCLKDKAIKELYLRAEKPDIISDTKSVGIAITRRNKK